MLHWRRHGSRTAAAAGCAASSSCPAHPLLGQSLMPKRVLVPEGGRHLCDRRTPTERNNTTSEAGVMFEALLA